MSRATDPWVVTFALMSVGTLGLLLVTDRYVELLAAAAAYGAAWVFAHLGPAHTDREEQR
jgi:hypothetical protein